MSGVAENVPVETAGATLLVVAAGSEAGAGELVSLPQPDLTAYSLADNVVLENIEVVDGVEHRVGSGSEQEENVNEDYEMDTEEEDNTDTELCEDEGDRSEMRRRLLDGWTAKDKYRLYKALQACDSSQLDKLQMILPNKSRQQIEFAIEYYKKKAEEKLSTTAAQFTSRKLRKNKDSNVPLTRWKKELSDAFTLDELQTSIADALRLIAYCENGPSPVEMSRVNFQELYLLLAHAMEARAYPDVSLESISLLRKVFTHIAQISKYIGRDGHTEHINTLRSLTPFVEPILDGQVSCEEEIRIRHLLIQKNYNPLRVPERLLHFVEDPETSHPPS